MLETGAGRSAIAVDGLEKRFRIARPKPEGKRRWRPRRHVDLEVLRGVSFAVERGELFGLMGRNGSGKSTLLKVISGVYPADSGTVEVDGRLAPAFQLGVGSSPELSAVENAEITGVLLGLSRREARRRVSSILEFAELEEFARVRLKDLSNGMRMRLAFAALVQTNPDILLVDEILAVGDRAFQERCAESFAALRKRGRTIVLVSHATGLIERLCDRALLLEDGRVEALGDPAAVAARYVEVNVGGAAGEAELFDDGDQRRRAVLIADPRVAAVAGDAGEDPRIEVEATLEPQRRVESPGLRIEIRNQRGGRVFLSPTIELEALAPGSTPRVRAWVENRLHPGHYTVGVSVVRPGRHGNDVPASPEARIGLRIDGEARLGGGAVALRHGATVTHNDESAGIGAVAG